MEMNDCPETLSFARERKIELLVEGVHGKILADAGFLRRDSAFNVARNFEGKLTGSTACVPSCVV